MAENDTINMDALGRLFRAMGGDIGDLKDLFECFVEDTPPLFETMRVSSVSGDWAAFRRAAHTAKGAARDFGALAIADACARLEKESAAGPIADAAGQIADLEHAFSVASADLEELLNSGKLT